MRMSKQMLVAAAGTCLGMSVAQAQQAPALASGNVINVGGATLLQNFFTFRACYNDYIDADHNGVSGQALTGIQDLADPALGSSAYWIMSYRATGSGNGFKELLNFGVAADTGGVLGDNVGLCGYFGGGPWTAEANGVSSVPTDAWTNRERYINTSVPVFANAHFNYSLSNPGGNPNRADLTTLGILPGPGSAGGIRIDVGVLDVPSLWFVQVSGTPSATAIPNTAGYGTNPVVALNKNGTNVSANGSNKLATLPGGFAIYDPTLGVSTATTVFDSPVTWAPIGPVANFGVGRTQATMTDMRHLFTTGRMPTGENLMAVTRDSGSGTRNGWMTSMGIDPSFGRGENIGGKTADNATNVLGAAYQPSNKDGSGLMEQSVFNHRLGVGYTGAERAVTQGWILGGAGARADFLAIKNDIYAGATTFQRPTLSNILHNNVNGFLYGGPETFSTIGDPAAEPVANGGANNGHNKMRSQAAALWVNNILRSIEHAQSVPADPANFAMPGEEITNLYTPYAALDFVKSLSNPTTLQANPGFNSTLQTYMLGLSTNTFNNAAYTSFNTAGIGRSARTTGVTYSDGVVNGINYLKQDGNAQSYAVTLPLRDKISGDFNGDGLRDMNDICDMISAWKQRNGGPTWTAPAGTGAIAGAPGSDAIIEVLGDFDGDGNFNAADVRYFADGLAIDVGSGNLNRAAGFQNVDCCFGGNFFNTIMGPGATPMNRYITGASAADVAGAVGTTPGFAPVGADGHVDGKDIDYIYKQFKQNATTAGGPAHWNVLAEAVTFDLSADVNGDLVVDQNDVDLVVHTYLNTNYGDVNLDGAVDASDIATITANIGTTPATWARGDINGDGVISAADLALATANLGASRPLCPADLDNGGGCGIPDGGIDINDLLYFLAQYEAGVLGADLDDGSGTGSPDGGVDINDLLFFLSHYEGGC